VVILAHFAEARPQDIAKIQGWCAWFAEQDLCKQLEGQKVRAEMDFLVRIAGLPVRGTIDLYSPAPLLLDWKTSRVPKPEEYALQVAVYLAALSELGRPCPPTGQLVYVDAETICEVEPVALEPIIQKFRDAHGGTFEPKPSDACTYCDFRAACEPILPENLGAHATIDA